MTTEAELLQKLTIQVSHGEREYDPEDVFRLLEMTRRMKSALTTISWNVEASNPQAMIMKDEARKGLYGR